MGPRRTLAKLSVAGALAVVAVAGGCGDAPGGGATRAAAARRAPVPPGTGIVRGVVSFKGTAPEPEEVPAAKCHSSSGPVAVSPVSVSEDGRLGDVVVYVKDAAPTGEPPPPAGAAVLDQVNCRYVPHVLGVQVGQELTVKSSDPTLHNVHTLSVDNPSVNFGMTKAGESRGLTFGRPERVRVKCDVHPWMSAHVYVFDHPYFAVTAADGAYEIRGVRPGEHTLVFSHPFLGDRERKVTVPVTADGGTPAEVEVEAVVVFEKQ